MTDIEIYEHKFEIKINAGNEMTAPEKVNFPRYEKTSITNFS